MRDPLLAFHPATAAWFRQALGEPTEPQALAWPEIAAGRHTLIAAPTGSGKTLAAFLWAIDRLLREGLAGTLDDRTRVIYVSPLKALSNDVRKNLLEPLAGVAAAAGELGLPEVEIRTLVRTGDTPQSERTAMGRRPPHILVTTPESLYILLTSDGGRKILSTARTLIVDEIHAVAGDKRGSHLALTLERLEALTGPLQRIGLSATQRPVERVARFLVGGAPGERAPCSIVDVGHRRELDLAIEIPRSPLEGVMANEVWEEVYDRLAELAREHRTTLVFANTRRLAERVAHHLAARLGAHAVAAHHGSLARDRRLAAEQRLKAGDLQVLVATSSLELGIDIGSVDLVCQLGMTKSIAAFLQRVGRAGHRLGALPKGRIFPLSRDELGESVALFDAVRRGELEEVRIPERPLDVLAQQLVAAVAVEEWADDDLYALVRRADPYRTLDRETFNEVAQMLADGFSTRRGRRAAHLFHDEVHGRLRARRGARLAAVTSGGAIPDQGEFQVVLEPGSVRVGTVHEDFAIESLPGEVFQLGNTAWRILRIEPGRVLVEDARGAPPTLPFWFGESPGRSRALSQSLWRLREEIQRRLGTDGADPACRAAVIDWLAEEHALAPAAGRQLVDYWAAALGALEALPTGSTLVLERFFDEAGDMHLVLHAPFGARLNRAWGLALRKRFCQTFNFELQAVATEDAILLSLGPTHSFPLADAFRFLHPQSVRHVLTQALLDAPMFGIRWRWNASRALALLRFRGGQRVPPRLQRQEAEDLVAVVFPDQLACFENIQGEREIPEHPLIEETLHDCLTDVMDVEGLEAVLTHLHAGELRLIARELTEPSPLAAEVLGARPYAFLDDAPLEERRTQAVHQRRFLRPEDAAGLGALDPEAIAQVRREVWPDPVDGDEAHEALVQIAAVPATSEAARAWEPFLQALLLEHRATILHAGVGNFWVAAERLPEIAALHPDAILSPPIAAPARLAGRDWTSEDAAVAVVRSRLEVSGPVVVAELANVLALEAGMIEQALATLEGQGFGLRGRFTPGIEGEEWCERRLLARIHRLTLGRLRREIEPVSKSDFVRFLVEWQRVAAGTQARGADGLGVVLAQLEGFVAPAAAWESEILPARVAEYDPAWLDALCLAGRFAWVRLAPGETTRRGGPIRTTPIALVARERLGLWRDVAGRDGGPGDLSANAAAVVAALQARGASFFGEIATATRLLGTAVEDALAELAAAGLVTADSFTGLRALLLPQELRARPHGSGRGDALSVRIENAGRWSLLEATAGAAASEHSDLAVETVARALLARWGVVFRRLLERETWLPPWRELLSVLRRLEDRGEVRGGRFVDGFSGEQFALPEAIPRLRAARRDEHHGARVSLCGADPLNLLGIATNGERVPGLTKNRVLLRDGEPIAVAVSGEVTYLETLDPAATWEVRTALLRRAVPPLLRAYLGRTA